MEKKSKEKSEIFLPSSLMDDIDFDELDKELQFTSLSEVNNTTNQSNYLLYFNFFSLFIFSKKKCERYLHYSKRKIVD